MALKVQRLMKPQLIILLLAVEEQWDREDIEDCLWGTKGIGMVVDLSWDRVASNLGKDWMDMKDLGKHWMDMKDLSWDRVAAASDKHWMDTKDLSWDRVVASG
jgi:hypothetical protein